MTASARAALLVASSLLGAPPCHPGALAAGRTAAPPAPGVVEVNLSAVSGIPAGAFVLAQARSDRRDRWLTCYGSVVPGPRATVDVNAYTSGEVRQLFVRPGQQVAKGAALLSIYSPEFISTQRAHLALFLNKQRLEILREEGRLPNYLKDAEENLRWWGMSAAQIADLMQNGRLVEEITLQAPEDGVVTDLFVQPGSLVNAGDKTMNTFLVAGRSVARMVSTRAAYWIEASVFPDQLDAVAVGAAVRIRIDDSRLLERRVALVSPTVDARTQRARFAVDLERQEPGLPLGRAVEVSVRTKAADGVWLPRDAVLGQALSPAVYVQTGALRFERRPVSVLDETADALNVTGVRDGEMVVASGKMILEGVRRMSGRNGAANAGQGDAHSR